MAEVVLFHHILGLTPGVVAFADELRAARHTVHTPDLYDGRMFETIPEAQEFVKPAGWESWLDKAMAAADDLPASVVYAGISSGVTSAQKLAMTRPAALGALLLESFISPEWFGDWMPAMPVQIHGMTDDEFFAEDVEAARPFAATNPSVELFEYPGDKHLFEDNSLPSYDAEAAALLLSRVLTYLDAL